MAFAKMTNSESVAHKLLDNQFFYKFVGANFAYEVQSGCKNEKFTIEWNFEMKRWYKRIYVSPFRPP